MKPLIVKRSIEIAASTSRVWQVLTKPELNREWAARFDATGPIESDWKLGSAVLWRNAKGEVYVSGRVTEVEPGEILRFSVRGSTPDRQPMSGLEADDLTQTYSLAPKGEHTLLFISHGDFANLAAGSEIFPRVSSFWDALLPLIKQISERK